ncbi:MAG: hypothetical protein GX316_09235 [Firmicutes bacterium]|nr:hypothetical protein [Bacillota bacterium]
MATQWPVRFIRLLRAITAGVAYYSVINIPGVTSSMVAIIVAVLLFDLMISLERIRGGWHVWKEIIRIVIPGAAATAFTLIYGLCIGGISALLVYFGMPIFVGAVLTAGLSYSLAEKTPNRFSRSVGVAGGLAVFHKTYRIAATREFLSQAGPVIVSAIYGTFAALIMGWTLGILVGALTRLFLPRGYRSVTSLAYEQPIAKRSMQEVLHLDEWRCLARVEVPRDGAFSECTLATLDLPRKCQAWVLRIDRKGKTITLPSGDEKIKAGDVLLVYLPEPGRAQLAEVFAGEFQQIEEIPVSISGD